MAKENFGEKGFLWRFLSFERLLCVLCRGGRRLFAHEALVVADFATGFEFSVFAMFAPKAIAARLSVEFRTPEPSHVGVVDATVLALGAATGAITADGQRRGTNDR